MIPLPRPSVPPDGCPWCGGDRYACCPELAESIGRAERWALTMLVQFAIRHLS
jgi:hypothetical protein